MLNNLRYYFRLLFFHTKYIEICAIIIIYSFCVTSSPFSILSNQIIAEEYVCADMFAFFVNVGPVSFLYYSFMIILPLLIAVPVGQMLSLEAKNKSMILVRVQKKSNYIAKVFVVFVSGFFLTMLALGTSILFSHIILSSSVQNIHYISTNFELTATEIAKRDVGFYNLYLTSPFLVSIIYMVMISIYGGALALISLLTVNFYYNKVLVYCCPFLFVIGDSIAGIILPTILDLLYIEPRYMNFKLYLGCYLIIFILLIVISSIYYHRRDCF